MTEDFLDLVFLIFLGLRLTTKRSILGDPLDLNMIKPHPTSLGLRQVLQLLPSLSLAELQRSAWGAAAAGGAAGAGGFRFWQRLQDQWHGSMGGHGIPRNCHRKRVNRRWTCWKKEHIFLRYVVRPKLIQIASGDSEEDSEEVSSVDHISILLTWIDFRGSQICHER